MDLTELLRSQFRQVAKSLTRRANEPPRAQRRRGDAMAGGQAYLQTAPHPGELPEALADEAELFGDTLDWMNLWHDDIAMTGDPYEDVTCVEQEYFHPAI